MYMLLIKNTPSYTSCTFLLYIAVPNPHTITSDHICYSENEFPNHSRAYHIHKILVIYTLNYIHLSGLLYLFHVSWFDHIYLNNLENLCYLNAKLSAQALTKKHASPFLPTSFSNNIERAYPKMNVTQLPASFSPVYISTCY